MQQSMSLKYEPSAEPRHISAKQLFLLSQTTGSSRLAVRLGKPTCKVKQVVYMAMPRTRLTTCSNSGYTTGDHVERRTWGKSVQKGKGAAMQGGRVSAQGGSVTFARCGSSACAQESF